jgi:hypothetical protein
MKIMKKSLVLKDLKVLSRPYFLPHPLFSHNRTSAILSICLSHYLRAWGAWGAWVAWEAELPEIEQLMARMNITILS